MSIELWALFCALLAYWLALFVQVVAIDRLAGTAYALSNRTADAHPAVERIHRAIRNQVEGLVLLAGLVGVATATHVTNAWTQYAAMGFVAVKTVHFICYAAGVTHVRSAMWAASFFIATPAFVYGIVSGLAP
ncbi:MAG: MAPEG family protein [Myxococcota bacterium]